MENKESKKSSRVTIANIISAGGLALLLVFSVLGHTYMSGGEWGWDLLIPIAITVGMGLLLVVLIRVKGAENDLTRWKIGEGILLLACIGMIWVSMKQSGITHFFNALSQRNDIKDSAEADLNAIGDLFDKYESLEGDDLSTTETWLLTAIKYQRDEELSNFMTRKGIDLTKTSVDEYIENTKNICLFSRSYGALKEEFNNEKGNIINYVKNWNILLVGWSARRTVELKDEVETKLTGLSHEAELPNIFQYEDSYRFGISGKLEKEYKVAVDLKFKNKLQGLGGFNLYALIVVIIIHFLILFNYFVAYRTSTLGVRGDLEDDGGITL